MIVTDASVWIARLVPQDHFNASVKIWMEEKRVAGAAFLSPSLLLAEVAGAVSRRTNSSDLGLRAIEILTNLPSLRLVEMDAPLAQSAAQLAAELGLRGADSAYVAIADRLRLPLVTLDVEQRKRASHLVEIKEFNRDAYPLP